MPECGFASCDSCDFRVELVESWFGVEGFYRISASEVLPVLADWTWCDKCSTVTQMEHLPSVGAIRAEIRRSRMWSSGWGVGIWRATRAIHDPISRSQHLRLMRRMLMWRIERSAPPHCLTCGNEKCIPFTPDESMPHPGCVGNLTIELGSIWTGILESYDSYAPDGIRNGVYAFSQLPGESGTLVYFRDRDLVQSLQ